MLIGLILLQIVLVFAVLVLLLGRRSGAQAAPDPRHAQLPDQITHLHTHLQARHEALDTNLREGLSHLRREAGTEGDRSRESAARAFLELRTEVTGSIQALAQQLHSGLDRFRSDNAAAASGLRGEVTGGILTLGQTLTTELAGFRTDNTQAAAKLQADVHAQHEGIAHRLSTSANEAREHQDAAREALHTRLTELAAANNAHQEKLRGTVGDSLAKLNTDNTAKLEEMRATVDEKLHATLHSRLTESFGQVTDQLNKVHTGLGEMSKLSEGVDGLSRIFTNVKSRGGFAEVQLGMLLEQVLAPGQFIRNARIKPNSMECVEFAVRFPAASGETLLPIDAKFPREGWERLEAAYQTNDATAIAQAGRAFEAAIRTEGRRICEKYICPPTTTPHAIMFLPTEGLYAEVMRREALHAEIQTKCKVTIAGPSTLSAILMSFRWGFHMLALEGKGDEIRKVLEKAKGEFRSFELLMTKMEKQVGTVQNTIQELGTRTRVINRSLQNVSEEDPQLELMPAGPTIVPRLAANDGP